MIIEGFLQCMGTELYPSELCVNGTKISKILAQVFLKQNYQVHSLLPLDVRISKVSFNDFEQQSGDN